MKSPNCLFIVMPCKAFNSALLVLTLLSVASLKTHAADGTWTNETTTQSLWTGTVNWLNGIAASGAGSTATITVANTAATKTISLNNTTQTIGTLSIGNPNGTGVYVLSTGAMIFDNNGSSAQINIAAGSGAVTLASTLTNTINDSLLISQNSSSLLTFNSTLTGGTGSDNKVIEHAGTGTGGIRITNVIANGATGTVSVRQNNANGTLDLRAANTYTGGTVIDAGTLAVGNINALQNSTLDTGTSGAQAVNFTVAGTNTYNIGGLMGSDALAIGVNTISVGANNANTTYSGAISGTGGAVTKVGSGTLTLSGVNTYTGGTSINGGVLRVSSRDNFANRLLSLDGGTLEITANITGLNSANNTTLNAGGGTIRVGDDILGDWGSAQITGTGALTKTGAGTLVIASGSVNNNYSGGTFINEGVLSINKASALGDTASVVTFNGAKLLTTATLATTRATTLNASGGNFEVASGATNTWNGVVSGTGKLVKSGDGVLTLGGVNTFEGGVDINGGVLQINSNNRLGSAGGAVSFNGGTLRAVSNVGANRATTLNASGGNFEVASGATNTWSGVVSGTGNLTKSGAGALILGGNSSYTGTTTVNGGILVVNGTNSSANGLLTVNSGGTLGGAGTIGGNTLIQSGGTLAPGNSPGVLTILGDLTLEGAVVMELNGLGRGTEYDGINVGGMLTYGGTLTLNFGTAFSTGGSFNLFDFTNSSGNFESISLTGQYVGSLTRSGNTWTGTISGQDFAFYEETGNLNVVPEPTTVSLLIVAGLGLAGHVLRRRSRA